jgi:16S rRNA (uracil1498-N3)-methyltransferase
VTTSPSPQVRRLSQLQRLVVDPAQISGALLRLEAAQQHYLTRVLRLRAGDRFWALDGRGAVWEAVLQADLGLAELATVSPLSEGELRLDLGLPVVTLLAAVPKQGFEEVIRQGTELGVRRIVPLLTARTVMQPGGAKLDRWQRIAQEAAEQCEQLQVPEVAAPLAWGQALETIVAESRYIGVTHRAAPLLLHQLQALDPSVGASRGPSPDLSPDLSPDPSPSLLPSRSIAIAIGPEGGWTETEVEQAIAAGYLPVSLGPYILRAVTAPIVALSLIMGAAVGATPAPS